MIVCRRMKISKLTVLSVSQNKFQTAVHFNSAGYVFAILLGSVMSNFVEGFVCLNVHNVKERTNVIVRLISVLILLVKIINH